MGANNSVPKTAEFVNPNTEPNLITITQQVSNRIENVRRQDIAPSMITHTKQTTHICNNCAKDKAIQIEKCKEIVLNPYQKQLLDIENENFESKLHELESAVNKPINWTEDHKEELKLLESELLNCYLQYRGEPLRCSTNAKDYQKFIFEKQYKAILKHTQAAGDNANLGVN